MDFAKAYLSLKVRNDYFPMDTLPYLETIQSIPARSLCISIGGDNYCYSDYPKFIRIHRMIAGKCPTILLGSSLEPSLFKDRNLLEDLKTYDLITARESVTFDLLKQTGMKKVFLAPDAAFFLKPEYLPLPEGFQVGNTVGINISPLIISRETSPGIILDNYRELIRYLINSTESNIALIPHVVQRSSDDRIVLNAIYEEFQETKRVIMIHDCDCQKLKGYIARCRFMIAARTHASIAAYSSIVPTIVVGYSVKSVGIARDLLGTDEGYVISAEKINKKSMLLDAFKSMESKESYIKEQLKRAQTDAEESFRKLVSIFEQEVKVF